MQAVHGGELQQAASRLGVDAARLLGASASLAPFTPRLSWRVLRFGLRDYPDRRHALLRHQLAELHRVDNDFVLPGNGAAELFTWVARDAASEESARPLVLVLLITSVPLVVGIHS